MNIKLLTEKHLESLSLKGGCTGLSESIHVKMPHCWKSHVRAHMYLFKHFSILSMKAVFTDCILFYSQHCETYIQQLNVKVGTVTALK